MSNLFDDVVTPTVVDNPLEHLVGEGKKYADVNVLAKAALDKDVFIEQLKREQAELRSQLGQKATIEEIMTQIKSINKPTDAQPVQPPVVPDQAQLSPELLDKIFAENYQKQKKAEKLEANKKKVEDTLVERFGSEAQIKISEKARELGVPTTYLQQIGLDSPEALFTMLGVNAQKDVISRQAPQSRQVPPSQGSNVRNQEYYNRIKMTNPTEYFSPKIQNQMMKDALVLGESFF